MVRMGEEKESAGMQDGVMKEACLGNGKTGWSKCGFRYDVCSIDGRLEGEGVRFHSALLSMSGMYVYMSPSFLALGHR